MEKDRFNDILLEAILYDSFTIKNVKCKVLFHQGKLMWEEEEHPHTHQELTLNDVIAVAYGHKKDRSCCNYDPDDKGSEEGDRDRTSNEHFCFDVHHTVEEKNYNWRHKMITMNHRKSNAVDNWVRTLNSHLTGISYRPKRLIAFINPFCGKKSGLKVYNKAAKPLFDIAGVKVDRIITERANHARNVVETEDMDGYDGVITVGGDGTFSEIMNGLIMRTAKDKGTDINDSGKVLPKPQLRVGIIPCGSTNAIAYSIHGTTDIKTATLHIIKGNSTGLDVSSVHDSQNLLLGCYASVISYGYLGDTIRDSNKYRWMGPKRYDFSGFKNIFANRGYKGEIQFAAEAHDNVPNDYKCFGDCLRCQVAKFQKREDRDTGQWKKIRGKFLMVNGANTSCACPRSPNGLSPHCHIGDGRLDLVLVKHTSVLNNLRLLLTLSNKMKTVYDLPFVEVHRTRQFTFRALPGISDKISVWNCDGEILSNPSIHIRAHRQLLQVFFSTS